MTMMLSPYTAEHESKLHNNSTEKQQMILSSESKHQNKNIKSYTCKHNTKNNSFKLILFGKARHLKKSKFENKSNNQKDKPIPKNHKSPVLQSLLRI